MAGPKKQRLRAYLRPEQVEPLRYLARRRGVSIAELVRQGIDHILANAAPEEDPLEDLIGMVNTGLGDLSENHDEYLVKWIMEDNRETEGTA